MTIALIRTFELRSSTVFPKSCQIINIRANRIGNIDEKDRILRRIVYFVYTCFHMSLHCCFFPCILMSRNIEMQLFFFRTK